MSRLTPLSGGCGFASKGFQSGIARLAPRGSDVTETTPPWKIVCVCYVWSVAAAEQLSQSHTGYECVTRRGRVAANESSGTTSPKPAAIDVRAVFSCLAF